MPIPDFYRQLAADSEDYAVLDIPFRGWRASNTNMFYQVVHQHRIVGGFVYRVPSGVRPMMNFFKLLATPLVETDDIVKPLSGPDRAAILHHYNIAFVVLHKPELPLEELLLRIDLLESFPAEKVYEDEQIVAFRVLATDDVFELRPLLVVGENWCDIQLSKGAPSRWMSNDAVIYAGIPRDGEYELEFTTYSFQGSRHLQVYFDEREAGEFYVEGRQSYTVESVSLRGEDWTSIRFHAVEGCQESTEEELHGQGEGCLSFLFQNVQLHPI